MEPRNPGTDAGTRTNSPIDDVEEAFGSELSELRTRIDEATRNAAGFVRAHPGTSLLVAAAAGYLIGRLLRA